MNKEKDDFEESFGDSGFGNQDSDFNFDDEDEFDVSEDDVELSAFPDSMGSDEVFNSGSDDEFELEDDEELSYEDSDEEIEFEEDDFSEDDELEFDEEEPKEKKKLFGRKSSDADMESDGSNKSNIMKYAFYAGTVAIVGAIGYVGVNMFAPNLLGGSDDYYVPPAQVQQPVVPKNTIVNNDSSQNQFNNGAPVLGNTPPLPQPGVTPNIAQPGQIPGVLDNPRPGLQGGEQVVPQNNLNLGVTQDVSKNENSPSSSSKEFEELKVSVEDMSVAIGAILNKVDSLDRLFVTKSELNTAVGQEVAKQFQQNMPKIDMSQTVTKEDLESITSKVTNDMTNLQIAFEDALKSLELKTLEAENSQELLAEAENKIMEIETRFNSFEGQVSELQGVIESQRNEIAQLEKVIDTQKAEIASTKKTVNSVSRVQKEQIDARNAIGGGIEPPSKPRVLTNYRLAGVAKDMAWIETESGVSRIRIGQNIPGVGIIEGIRPVNGNWAVVTPMGLIMP